MSPPDLDVLEWRRRKRRRRNRHRRRRRGAVFAAIAAVGLSAFAGASAVAGLAAFSSSCDLNSLRPVAIGQNSFVYAADGSLLGAIPAERNRQPVPLGDISPWMAKATIAIEDRRFYEHGGIDPGGIARALWADVRAGRVVQGGSTITQQLVRNLYPVSRERTIQRKAKEACLAIKLNRQRSKAWILATYMNTVYYGSLAYGIEAAAQTYFSKPARDLSLAEAALLAGLPQAPSFFDPFREPERALDRRDEVLRALLEGRYITRGQYERAVADRELRLKAGKLYTEIKEPYFFGYVRDELIREYGVNTVRSGGLKVYTTIVPRYQRAATKAIRDTLYLRDDPAAALVAIDPRNGAIRAMAAVTPGRTGNQFNLVAQARRQAGSTFKTFVLAAAIEQGVNPDTTYYRSAPFRYQPDPLTPPWLVQTYSKTYLGYTSVTRATLASDNTVYAQLTLDVGPEKVADMARRLGVKTPLDVDGAYVPSLGLGSIAISPLDMASAYTTLAAGGVYSEPMAIRKVVLASGKVDSSAGWGVPRRRRVVADWVAAKVTEVLAQNMVAGTGRGAYFSGRPMAGKTGTTDDWTDAWFSAYTPTLEATVWAGYPRGRIPMENVHGIAVAGGTFPATIWRLFMEPALGSSPPGAFPVPAQAPEWKPFARGQYALGYYSGGHDDETTAGETASGETATTEETAPAPAPETTAARVPAPPATTAPPSPATTAPPPSPTTEAPAAEPPPSTRSSGGPTT